MDPRWRAKKPLVAKKAAVVIKKFIALWHVVSVDVAREQRKRERSVVSRSVFGSVDRARILSYNIFKDVVANVRKHDLLERFIR